MPGTRLTAAWMCLLLLPGLAAAQDSVKIGGFWIDNVAVQGVVDGQIVYLAAGGGEVSQPLERLEGLKLGRYPAMAQAQAALEAGDDSEALRHLTTLRGAAREPWLQRYTGKLLMEAADRAGKADVAAEAFVTLATTPSIDEFYLASPPTASVAAADDKTKAAIKQRLAAAGARLPKQGAIAEAAAALTELVKDAGAQPTETAPGVVTPPTPANGTAAPPTPAAPKSAVVLPHFIEDDAVTKLLRGGQFAEAEAAAATALLSSGDLSLKLYQHGRAKLGLADAATDDETAEKLYKDAGISFMRVIVHFPASRYKGAALVEAGYVHQKIGRPDIARRLYQAADMALGDPEETPPDYFDRLRQLNESLAGP